MRVIRINASAQISDKKISIKKIAICGGSDAATVTLYNEADTSATATLKAAKLGVAASTSNNQNFDGGLYLETGCYAEITGTTPEVFIYVE